MLLKYDFTKALFASFSPWDLLNLSCKCFVLFDQERVLPFRYLYADAFKFRMKSSGRLYPKFQKYRNSKPLAFQTIKMTDMILLVIIQK